MAGLGKQAIKMLTDELPLLCMRSSLRISMAQLITGNQLEANDQRKRERESLIITMASLHSIQ